MAITAPDGKKILSITSPDGKKVTRIWDPNGNVIFPEHLSDNIFNFGINPNIRSALFIPVTWTVTKTYPTTMEILNKSKYDALFGEDTNISHYAIAYTKHTDSTGATVDVLGVIWGGFFSENEKEWMATNFLAPVIGYKRELRPLALQLFEVTSLGVYPTLWPTEFSDTDNFDISLFLLKTTYKAEDDTYSYEIVESYMDKETMFLDGYHVSETAIAQTAFTTKKPGIRVFFDDNDIDLVEIHASYGERGSIFMNSICFLDDIPDTQVYCYVIKDINGNKIVSKDITKADFCVDGLVEFQWSDINTEVFVAHIYKGSISEIDVTSEPIATTYFTTPQHNNEPSAYTPLVGDVELTADNINKKLTDKVTEVIQKTGGFSELERKLDIHNKKMKGK